MLTLDIIVGMHMMVLMVIQVPLFITQLVLLTITTETAIQEAMERVILLLVMQLEVVY